MSGQMDFLKTVGGKIVSGLVGVAVIAVAISWWRMDPATRQMLLTGTGRIVSWFLVVLLVPWATFFIIGRVGRMDSNGAGAALVLGYTLLEAVLLAGLFKWSISGTTALVFYIAAILLAGAYNLLACDWIAEKVE
jgi:FtsH-binding integral membrane protein